MSTFRSRDYLFGAWADTVSDPLDNLGRHSTERRGFLARVFLSNHDREIDRG